MAKMHKNLFAQLYAGEFGGIDRQSSLGQANVAQDIKNFRILADGSLEKRCGYSKVIGLPAGIRAVWSGDVDGEASLFVLAGDMVYLVNETREHRACPVSAPGRPVLFSGRGPALSYRRAGCVFPVADGRCLGRGLCAALRARLDACRRPGP